MAARIKLRLIIPTEFRLVDLAHQAAESVAGAAGFPPAAALDVGLAVREAVINAMKHGNRLDASRLVEVVLRVNGGGVTATVRDQGEGFDPSTMPDPTDPSNVLRSSGRGLLLIRSFVDRVGFRYRRGRGMEITLGKRLDSPGTERGVGS